MKCYICNFNYPTAVFVRETFDDVNICDDCADAVLIGMEHPEGKIVYDNGRVSEREVSIQAVKDFIVAFKKEIEEILNESDS